MSVSRDKRGLPAVIRPALPQVVELAFVTTNERKTDTMKTYILKNSTSVEPQPGRKNPTSQSRSTPRASAPAATPSPQAPALPSEQTPTSLADVSLRGSQPSEDSPAPILFIGMDVHNDSIAVSLAPSDSTEVRR